MLAQVEARWAEYTETLRQVVRLASGRRIEDAIGAVPYELVLEAEERRGKVYGPLAALEINLLARVEFDPFVEPSLRTTGARKLFEAVAEPLNNPQVVSHEVLEARLGDARRLLERMRLELGRDLAVAQARLAAARESLEPTLRGVLEKWGRKGNVVARSLLWLFGHKIQVGLGALLAAALGAVYHWLEK